MCVINSFSHFFYSINVIQLIERLLRAKPYASKGKETKEENQECQEQDGSGLQFAVECSGWVHRRVTFEPRCQRGELCPNLVNHNNHKSKHLLGLTPFGKEPQKVLTLEFEQQSQICRPKLLVMQNNKELSHFPGSTPYFFPLTKNFL